MLRRHINIIHTVTDVCVLSQTPFPQTFRNQIQKMPNQVNAQWCLILNEWKKILLIYDSLLVRLHLKFGSHTSVDLDPIGKSAIDHSSHWHFNTEHK